MLLRSPLSPVAPISTKIYMTCFEDYKKNYHDIKKIAEVCMFKYIVVNVFSITVCIIVSQT
jgi:hypothetical protein